MQLIDTHAHLDEERFQGDLDAVLERAARAGVVRVISVATTAGSSLASIDLARKHPLLAASVGIHPNHVAQSAPSDWDQVVSLATQPGVVAVGETGLDRHWHDTPFADQEDYFARHLALSRQTGLPVIIHCRKADADIVRMLRADFDAHGPVHGVMHSFSGDHAMAESCLAMGLYISFAGMLTYKNAQDLRDVAARLPVDRLLVETDSPYLAPVPCRGERNEPALVKHTALCLAQTLGIDAEELATQTTQNARKLFAL